MRRYLVLIGLLLAIFAGGGVLAGDAVAVESGDVITFIVPAAGPQPDLTNDPKDKLIITGGRITMTDTTGCAGGSHPVQNAVLVNPGSQGAERLTEVIIVSQAEPLRPGTTLNSIALDSGCVLAATGRPYVKYNGTVE